MKLILAATDFSKASRNAINYAAEMAKRTKARLLLFHSYMPPVIASDVPVVLPSSSELEKDAMKAMKRIATSLQKKHGGSLKTELVCQYGLAVAAIIDYAEENKADLIVMGMKGAGPLKEKLFGSITTDVIKKSKRPVLSIGHDVKFNPIKHIAFATDYQEIASFAILDPVKELATQFKAHIHLLNVAPDSSLVPTVSHAIQGIKTNHAFDGYKHSFHAIINKSVADGIKEFTGLRKMDLVVMIARKHSFFQTLFKSRTTKHVAFHTNTPLLTIHE